MAKKAAKPAAKKSSGKIDLIAQHEKMKALVTEMEVDVRKLVDEGVKAAARRVRGNAQEIKKICQQMRKDTMTVVKAIKGKK